MKMGRILAGLLFAVMLASGAWAQDDSPAEPNGEAAPRSEGPQPSVARISLIYGDVSTQRGDTGDWAATSVNAPVVQGDQVATGDRSRTEIQLDYANLLRLSAQSQIKIADLSGRRIQIQVAHGDASYTMFKGTEAEVELDTPNVAVHPLRNGRYRVQVNSDAETEVIVREGEAEITTPQGSTRVREGEMITVRGTDSPEYRVSNAPGKDDWDRWNRDRDNVIHDSDSWSKTNRYYTGVNDLDGYGRWVYVPGYGSVWQPYQQAAWAPYQSGRWVWEPYYGWTWVSYEAWGWAPYHYGRWFFYSGSWCWWPGPVYVHYRPVWSPAFVFFVGFGHRSGVAVGFGSIGWFPVGPHDAFYPWYGRGFNRVNVVNVTNINVINVHNTYVAPLAVRGRQPYYSNASLVQTNARVRGSITTVASEDFGRGNFEHRRFGVEEHEWHDARVMTANLPVVPSHDSLRAGRGGAQSLGTVQPRNNERFYTRHQPPAGPESFHDQMQRVQRVVGPEAAGAQGSTHTDFHAGPGQVERRDGGNVPARIGNAEVPKIGGGAQSGNQRIDSGNPRVNIQSHGDGSVDVHSVGREGNEGSRDGFHRSPAGNEQGGSIGGPKDSPGRMSDSVNTELSGRGNNTTSASAGIPAQEGSNRDRGGWTKFGGGGNNGGASGQSATPTPHSTDMGRVPRNDSPQDTHRGNDSPSWQKFPSSGGGQSGDRGGQSPDRTVTPGSTPTPRSQDDRGSWQRFPQSNNDRGSRNSNDGSTGHNDGGSKPPLQLKHPIVSEPRQPDVRNEPRFPSQQRTPDVHNEPRYSPPQHSEPRYTPPSGGGHSDSHYSPRSESHSSSSSHGGSGDRGSHSDSKTSSNPKQR